MSQRTVLLACALAVPCGAIAAGPPAPARSPAPPVAILHATLIDGTGQPPLRDATILVRDGRITTVAAGLRVKLPKETVVIDGSGKYVIPGLADMHVHFGTGGLDPADPTMVDRLLRQFLFYGVTTVLNIGGGNGNVASIVAIRDRAAQGPAVTPQIFATGGLLTLPGSHPVSTIMSVPEGADPEIYDWEPRGVTLVRSPDDVRAAVRERAAAGMDGIKIVVESGPPGFGDDHPQMPPAMIAAAAFEASRAGLPVFAHVSSIDELEDAVEGGVRAVVHAVTDPNPEPSQWVEVKRRDVFLVPTLSLFAGLIGEGWTQPEALDEPFLRSGVAATTLESLSRYEPPGAAAPPAVRAARWATLLASVRAAHEAGVRIAAGTDTANPLVFPGYSIHRELEFLVEAGLTPMEALVAATRRAAELMESDDFGTIEPGRRADLVVLAEDPLRDIRNTRSVETIVLEGRVLDRSALLVGSPGVSARR